MGNAAASVNGVNREETLNSSVSKLIPHDELDDDQLIKIQRRLEYSKSQNSDPCLVVRSLVDITKHGDFKVPKVRFGKTEIEMPIVTCGGMRVQQTWCPDTQAGLATSSMSGIDKKCQENLIQIIRRSLSHGINHFETARMYGTSELQYCDALATMIESGEIKRQDIIVQTKVAPAKTAAEFQTVFEASWKHMKRLGYIDLFSFHGVSTNQAFKFMFDNGDDSNMPIAEKFLAEGRIRNIGVSTHGSASFIRKLIETDKFSYVNLHYNYFGSYHASGTPDGGGGQGNALNIKLARDRDMGLFSISPFDKGGALYKPSHKLASLIGSEMSPIEFQSLWSWRIAPVPVHTVVVGAARPSDFDEVVAAARKLQDDRFLELASQAEKRLDAAWAAAVGGAGDDDDAAAASKWWEGVPDFMDPVARGHAVGHVLWLHGLVKAFGMWDFARARYQGLEATTALWKATDSVDKNMEKWSYNPGTLPPLDEKALRPLLEKCPKPEKVAAKIKEAHNWLTKTRKDPTNEERSTYGWEVAYDLVPWESFPGDNVNVKSVVLQQLSPLRRVQGGPNSRSSKEAGQVRSAIASSCEKNGKEEIVVSESVA